MPRFNDAWKLGTPRRLLLPWQRELWREWKIIAGYTQDTLSTNLPESNIIPYQTHRPQVLDISLREHTCPPVDAQFQGNRNSTSSSYRWGSNEPICNSLLLTASRQLVCGSKMIQRLGFKGRQCGNKGINHEIGQSKANLNDILKGIWWNLQCTHQYTPIEFNIMAGGCLGSSPESNAGLSCRHRAPPTAKRRASSLMQRVRNLEMHTKVFVILHIVT